LDRATGLDGKHGVIERFSRSLKYRHPFREEIADVLELDWHVRAFRELYNRVRPHETLGFVPPMPRLLELPDARSTLSGARRVQHSSRGTVLSAWVPVVFNG
jgi:hypothetical protein